MTSSGISTILEATVSFSLLFYLHNDSISSFEIPTSDDNLTIADPQAFHVVQDGEKDEEQIEREIDRKVLLPSLKLNTKLRIPLQDVRYRLALPHRPLRRFLQPGQDQLQSQKREFVSPIGQISSQLPRGYHGQIAEADPEGNSESRRST